MNAGDGLGVPFKVCSPVIFIIFTVFLDVLNVYKENFKVLLHAPKCADRVEELGAERHSSKPVVFKDPGAERPVFTCPTLGRPVCGPRAYGSL